MHNHVYLHDIIFIPAPSMTTFGEVVFDIFMVLLCKESDIRTLRRISRRISIIEPHNTNCDFNEVMVLLDRYVCILGCFESVDPIRS
jgi:hypothetical protein